MRQIAIALVLFQLIDCTPLLLSTHAAGKTPKKTPLENTQKAPKAREIYRGRTNWRVCPPGRRCPHTLPLLRKLGT